MSLHYPNGESLTTAVAAYSDEPLTDREDISRIIVQVEILGVQTRAMVDTGGVYLLCSPNLATAVGLLEEQKLDEVEMTIGRWGGRVTVDLYRIPMRILPDEGSAAYIEVTAGVPRSAHQAPDEDAYVILGYHCCLERTPIAVDPARHLFHFGSPD